VICTFGCSVAVGPCDTSNKPNHESTECGDWVGEGGEGGECEQLRVGFKRLLVRSLPAVERFGVRCVALWMIMEKECGMGECVSENVWWW
jgi:hypothetical protein